MPTPTTNADVPPFNRLHTDPKRGIVPSFGRKTLEEEVEWRMQDGSTRGNKFDHGQFSKNALPEKELRGYCELIMEGLEDLVMRFLMGSAFVQLILGIAFGACGHGVGEVLLLCFLIIIIIIIICYNP